MQTHRHVDTQTCRHTDMQTYRHADIQTYRHADMHTCRHLDIQAHRHTGLHFARHCTSIIPTRLASLQPMTWGLLIQAKPETRHLTHWPRGPRCSAWKGHIPMHKMLHVCLSLLFQMVTDPIKQDNANIGKPTRRAHANY